MKDKATRTFIVTLLLFTAVLAANLAFSNSPQERAYIELGRLKEAQATYHADSQQCRAEIEANGLKWHEAEEAINELEAELF